MDYYQVKKRAHITYPNTEVWATGGQFIAVETRSEFAQGMLVGQQHMLARVTEKVAKAGTLRPCDQLYQRKIDAELAELEAANAKRKAAKTPKTKAPAKTATPVADDKMFSDENVEAS